MTSTQPYTAEALYPSVTVFVFEFVVAPAPSTACTYHELLEPTQTKEPVYQPEHIERPSQLLSLVMVCFTTSSITTWYFVTSEVASEAQQTLWLKVLSAGAPPSSHVMALIGGGALEVVAVPVAEAELVLPAASTATT